MTAGVLIAMTLPGLVIGLVIVAAVGKLLGRRDASAAGLDVFTTSLSPAKEHELAERADVKIRRVAAPTPDRIDTESGTARIRISSTDPDVS